MPDNMEVTWLERLARALDIGTGIVVSTEEFNAACDHIVRLLKDASTLLKSGSHSTATPQFVKAVEATGFELQRLDHKPQAGLIDNHMRVAIRSAKFLVADLSDANNGAYWESGFAEGQDKKVYYTCEESKFNAIGTHFDTNHLLTVKWSQANMANAMDTLKSAIRNDFPVEAKLIDSPEK